MPYIKPVARQFELSAVARLTFEDLETGVALEALQLPGDAIVTGGHIEVQTAFDSGTSDEIVISDGTTTYLTATSVAATGVTEFTTPIGAQVAVPTDISVTLTSVGGPASAGDFLLVVNYVVEGRQNENQ